jgi:phosphoribosylformylglycinamidine (FGAM) synthase-like enzyme
MVVQGQATGHPPAIDMSLEKRVQAACRHGIAQGWVRSAHDSAEGGLAVALAESCISGQLGASVTVPLDANQTDLRWDRALFGEGGTRILVSVSPEHQAAWETYLAEYLSDHWQPLGTVQGNTLTLTTQDGKPLIADTVAQLADIWGRAIAERLAA